ncbi:MAG: ATP-grasp domain-containing protein [Planctomycetaceae bacterium]|nr:ATP-grasp domain-containing protein [Planctomycetaceae bacterium]
MDRVLILHNTFGCPDDPLYQSRAGVMDQVGAVEQSLNKLGTDYQIVPVENLKHLTALLTSRPERLLFNLAEEFTGSADACYAPAICDAFGKSCTGNDTPALLLALNKMHAKAILSQAGLPCPQGMVCQPNRPIDLSRLPAGRYILKPACSDASEGITADSVVELAADLPKALKYISGLHTQFNQPVIVEQFIPARELNVSVIEMNGTPTVMPLAEIDFSAFEPAMHKIVDYAAKWHPDSFGFNNTPRKIPADLPQQTAKRVRSLAVAAWDALGCRDYARVDFRLDETLNPYILEINPNPDISPDAGFAAAIAAAGIAYERFVEMMLDNAQKRLSLRNIK